MREEREAESYWINLLSSWGSIHASTLKPSGLESKEGARVFKEVSEGSYAR